MSKKQNYMSLLKEAINHDPPIDNVDAKGPMLDAILTYKGDGEMTTHRDAASILERYYFGENNDSGVNVLEAETKDNPIDNEIDQVPSTNIDKTKKDIEKEIKEAEEMDDDDFDIDDELEDDDDDDEGMEESYGMDIGEDAIIEKLIEEMESDILEDEDLMENRVPGDRGVGGTKAAGTLDSSPEKLLDEMMEEMMEEDEDLDMGDLDDISENSGPGFMANVDDNGDELEEAFQIFQESLEDDDNDMMDDDVDDIDINDIMV